jgi:hypothetical protein
MAKDIGCAETIEKVVVMLCLKERLAISISGATKSNSIMSGTADENIKPNVCALVNTKRLCRILITKRFCRSFFYVPVSVLFFEY